MESAIHVLKFVQAFDPDNQLNFKNLTDYPEVDDDEWGNIGPRDGVADSEMSSLARVWPHKRDHETASVLLEHTGPRGHDIPIPFDPRFLALVI